MENFIKKITKDVDLSFAILLSFCVYVFFAINIEVFFSHNISFAILERFAVLGLVGLALTICIIAGEIDLSIGSNAALCAVIVVKLTDPLGAPLAMIIGLSVSTLIGATQGFVIAFIRIRAIVITVGTLMLLRGVALLIAEEKTVMLTDFRVPDFITTKVLMYFSPASLTVIFIFICVGIFMRYTKYGREKLKLIVKNLKSLTNALESEVYSDVSAYKPEVGNPSFGFYDEGDDDGYPD